MTLQSRAIRDLTNIPISNYDRETTPRHIDTIHDIHGSLSLVESLLKGRNAPICRKLELMHLIQSGTDGLVPFYPPFHTLSNI